MLIITDMHSQIIEKSDTSKYTDMDLYTLDMKLFESEVSENDFIEGKIHFTSPYIRIKNDRLLFISTPANYANELYYTKVFENNSASIIISDNFWELVKKIKVCGKNLNAINFFKSHGFAPIGETLIESINRLQNHSVYIIEDKMLIRKNITVPILSLDDSEMYVTFKNKLNSILDFYTEKNKSHCVYLSGGADSRLLLLLLAQRTNNLTAVTNETYPQNSNNNCDIVLANKIAGIIGVPVKNTVTDFFKIYVKDYDNIIRLMPNSAHMAFPFQDMGNASRNCDLIWCGQNADTLYNYGATGRINFYNFFSGAGSALIRFLLSDSYFKTLYGKRMEHLPEKAFAKLVCLAYEKRLHCNLELPKSTSELIFFFQNSNHYLPLGSRDDLKILAHEDIPPDQIRTKLLEQKLNFITGGDAKAVLISHGECKENKIIMPYSYEPMLSVFYSLKLGFKDIIFPKRYIYRYINEFKSKYGNKIAEYNNVKSNADNINTAYEKVIASDLGRELCAYTDDIKEYADYPGLEKTLRLLYNYWIIRVFQFMEEIGAEFTK